MSTGYSQEEAERILARIRAEKEAKEDGRAASGTAVEEA